MKWLRWQDVAKPHQVHYLAMAGKPCESMSKPGELEVLIAPGARVGHAWCIPERRQSIWPHRRSQEPRLVQDFHRRGPKSLSLALPSCNCLATSASKSAKVAADKTTSEVCAACSMLWVTPTARRQHSQTNATFGLSDTWAKMINRFETSLLRWTLCTQACQTQHSNM